MFSKVKRAILIYNCLIICLTCYPTKSHDAQCGTGSNLGVCKALTECPSAFKLVKEKKNHNLARCGFNGFEEIVCCPDFKSSLPHNQIHEEVWDRYNPNSLTTLSNSRKSEIACRNYLANATTTIGHYIIDGEDALLGEFPHMAHIGFESADFSNLYDWNCGGSLISDRFILTAAHCIATVEGIPPSRVRLGFIDTKFRDKVEGQEHVVKNFVVHPDYSRRTKSNDIALIELETSVERTVNVYPACLYQHNNDPHGLKITGWGHKTYGGQPSEILQKADIDPISIGECSRLFERRSSINITSLQICCLTVNSSVDTCQGDSGGPLQLIASNRSNVYFIVGITSYGQSCGGRITPGVYTRVSAYLDWIENIVWS